MSTFVIGDLHGAHKALLQVMERAKFDKEKDTLISLGDICDGWIEVRQCVDEILSIKNYMLILGNHDQWFIDWYQTGCIEPLWFSQGGQATLASYGNHIPNVPDEHKAFFEGANIWYQDDENRLFTHGGFDFHEPLEKQSISTFLWDRSLIRKAMCDNAFRVPKAAMTCFKEVYIGHTATNYLIKGVYTPLNFYEIWAMDTGAGWGDGVLTMMDIDTKQYWQSDKCATLYPGVKGRGM